VHPLLADPFIAAQVDAALAPYLGRLPQREVSWMRDQLAETLASDPHAARVLRRARPSVVAESGEVRRDGVPGGQAPELVPELIPELTRARPKAAG
jgi:hypothetical protein